MKPLIMAAASLALWIGVSSAKAQTSPQTPVDQAMPRQPNPAQTALDKMETRTSPSTQAPDASALMSDADKRKISSCMKKSPEAIKKDKKCAAMMDAHPETAPPAPSQQL